jgi:hypothetical protein
MLENGLITDYDPIDQPNNSYPDALNMVRSRLTKNKLATEKGNVRVNNSFPSTTTDILNIGELNNEEFVIFGAGKLGGSDRIGLYNVNTDVYTDLIVDNLLNFNINYPILKIEFEFNYLGERIIVWTDNNNSPCVLNIDNIPFTLDGNKALVDPTQIKDLYVFSKINYPNTLYNSVFSPNTNIGLIKGGGNVKAGHYSFVTQYESLTGQVTSFTPAFGSVIVCSNTAINEGGHASLQPGANSSYSIRMTFSNLDKSFDFLNVIALQTINGITTAIKIGRLNITASITTIEFNYIGSENLGTLSLSEVLTPLASYTKAGAMTKYNGEILFADLSSEEDLDLQQYVNQIRIDYTTRLQDAMSTSNHSNGREPAGFGHGEVYAMYLVALFNNNTIAKAFHIPGRQASGSETTIITETDTGFLCKRFQIENTCDRSSFYSSLPDGTRINQIISNFNINMGYWENENETYPSNFPLFANQKVRHHVFPSIKQCKITHYSDDNEYGTRKLDVLGIRVSNFNLPPEVKSKISGWFIAYAKKDYSNSRVLGTDYINYVGINGVDTSVIYANPMNWSHRTLPSGNVFNSKRDYLRCNSFGLIKDKPPISTVTGYVESEIEIRKRLRPFGADQFIRPSEVNGHGYYSMLWEVYTINMQYTSIQPFLDDFTWAAINRRRIIESRYVPANVIDGKYNNYKGEENLSLQLQADFITEPSSINYDNTRDVLLEGARYPVGEATGLYTIRQLLTNVHNQYTNQQLVSTNMIFSTEIPTISDFIIYGGDKFIGINSIIRSSMRNNTDINPTEQGKTFRAVKTYICEDKYNLSARAEGSDNNSKFFPLSELGEYVTDRATKSSLFDVSRTWNLYNLPDDYSKLNEYNQAEINGSNTLEVSTKDPNLIIRSDKSDDNIIGKWKTFRVANRTTTNRGRGKIVNLETLDDVLLIHQEFGLFRTTGKDKLSLEVTEIYLGTADLFEQTPKELVASKLGYLGLISVFNAKRCKDRYIWVNTKEGRVFSLSAQNIIEASKEGNFRFFREYYKVADSLATQVRVGYDPIQEIVYFTSFNGNTISMELESNKFISRHSYTPKIYFNGLENTLYIDSNNNFRKMRVNNVANYEGVQRPSEITIVLNDNKDVNKEFYQLNWITEAHIVSTNPAEFGFQVQKTFDKVIMQTPTQTSGQINLIPFTGFGVNYNIRRERNRWNFNKLKESNSDPFKKRPLVGEYLKVKFIVDNNLDLLGNQNIIYLYDLKAKILQSEI